MVYSLKFPTLRSVNLLSKFQEIMGITFEEVSATSHERVGDKTLAKRTVLCRTLDVIKE